MSDTSLAEMATNTATTEPVVENEQNSEAVTNDAEDISSAEATLDEDGHEDNEDSEVESKVKPKKGFEKRIAKEVARKNEALRESEYWKKVALERGAGEPQKATPVVQAAKPKFADYNDIEAYTEALTDWKMESKLQEASQKTKQATQVETYQSRLKDFEKANPDFQEVLASTDAQISDAVKQAVFESDVGPAVLYYLANNEDEAERISGMSVYRQVAEIGKIEAKLVAQKPKEKKVTSTAPAPIKTVSGGAPVTTKKFDDPMMPADEWIKSRNKLKGFK